MNASQLTGRWGKGQAALSSPPGQAAAVAHAIQRARPGARGESSRAPSARRRRKRRCRSTALPATAAAWPGRSRPTAGRWARPPAARSPPARETHSPGGARYTRDMAWPEGCSPARGSWGGGAGAIGWGGGVAIPVLSNMSPVARRLEGCLRHVVKGWGTREEEVAASPCRACG